MPIERNGRASMPPYISDMDFERETKVKYRRSSNVPDYRHSSVPVFAPSYNGNNGDSLQRDSDSFSFAPSIEARTENPSRSTLDLPTDAAKSNGVSHKKSESTGIPRISENREPRRSGVMSFPAARSGAVSPLTYRSVSPVGHRSGAVSPITTRHGTASPIAMRSGAVSPMTGASTPIYRNRSPSGPERARYSMQQGQTPQQLQKKAAARRQVQSLNIDTQVDQPQTPGSEGSEEFDEIISLSPAVRAPVKKFRRLSAHPESSTQGLDSILENGERKPYFGQDVNPEDLVAINLENAFDRL